MPDRRLNVLFIPIDDLRPQLGCYGRAQMVTPHIDRLAATGVTFTRAYCQVPVCGATRASLITGVRPTRDRFVTFESWIDQDLPGALTLPEHFRNHGYVTLANGKVIHHITDAADRSWSEPPWYAETYGRWRNYLDPENRARGDADPHGAGPPFECLDVADNAYFDGQFADHAIEDLRRLAAQDQPWFLAVGFVKPHLPFNAPKRYWDLYRPGDIHTAPNPFRPEGAPDEAIHNWGELRQYFRIPGEGPVSDEMARTLVHGYYAATSYTDAQVGRVLDELDRLGLADSTVVCLWGDHGWQLGEHTLWCKHCNFNTSLNAPLIIRAPGGPADARAADLCEFLDVFPTLCDLAGLPIPDYLHGRSLVPILEDPRRTPTPAAFARYFSGDSVRTDRYLYTEWTDPEGAFQARMLYDHTADAEENVNIAERPELADTVASLSRMLRENDRLAHSI
jgi:arylsulfatase A-like enzyme